MKDWKVSYEEELKVSKKLNQMFKLGRKLDYDTIGMKCYFDEMYQNETKSSKSVHSLLHYFYLGDWEGNINYSQNEVDGFITWILNYNK